MWLFIYILLSVLEIVGEINSNEVLIFCTKPLLLPILLVWFLKHTRFEKLAFKSAMIVAIIASFLGDVLLLLVPQNEVFFLLGLGSFFIAQIAYGIGFIVSIKKSKGKGDPKLYFLFAILFASYYWVLMNVLWLDLGHLTISVLSYGVAICFMGLTAAYRYNKVVWHSYWYILAGAIAFIISDSILALNKFAYIGQLYQADIWIMLTYCFAQYAIVRGGIIYINSIEE